MTTNRVPISRRAPAYPKLMRRIGLFQKLWEAERRAITYSDAVRTQATTERCREARKKREAAE